MDPCLGVQLFTPPVALTTLKPTPTSKYNQLRPEDVFLVEKFQLEIVFTLGSYSSCQNFSERILPLALSVGC